MKIASFGIKMKECEYLPVESAPALESLIDSSHYRVDAGDIYYDSYFIEQLRKEKLRAQRSKSKLSIILLTLDQHVKVDSVDMNVVLDHVQTKIRDTDISGFVNDKTIGLLLPNTDENGSKELCEKLVTNNNKSEFTITASTYPDNIFENLVKIGSLQPDSFPSKQESSKVAEQFKLLMKRAIDIAGAILAMVTLMPVMLLTAVAIKLTSPGPVVFKQKRLGKGGVPFTFYKFRSMKVSGKGQVRREYLQDYINEPNTEVKQGSTEELLNNIKADSRVTKIGRFIQKTHIDELPQFFNVLKGDMSLVGPRPPLTYQAEKYQNWHLRRILEMKPGLTGLWLVEGRSKRGWDNTVRLDIRYIQRWTLMLDFTVLVKTILRDN